jgi:Skp family chaperone for outer membrane proteins
MNQPGTKHPLRAAVTLLASSTMIALMGTASAWALTPSSPSTSPANLAQTGHGLMLAQATQQNQGAQEMQKGIEEEQKGVQEEQKGVQEEQKGIQEEKQGIQEEQKGIAEQQKGMQEEQK